MTINYENMVIGNTVYIAQHCLADYLTYVWANKKFSIIAANRLKIAARPCCP